MTPVDRLRAKLPSAKRNGRGWVARCPAHDDRRPSLSIAQGNDGRALICCHAGCTIDAICAALGIGKVELFPDCINGYTRDKLRPKSVTTYARARDAPVGIVPLVVTALFTFAFLHVLLLGVISELALRTGDFRETDVIVARRVE